MSEQLSVSLPDSIWVKEVYRIIRDLLQDRRLSGNPNLVTIKRYERDEIHPCAGVTGPIPLKLNQLEWASKEGRFWFDGPIESLEVKIDRRGLKGWLEMTYNQISLVFGINPLNYQNFSSLAQKLKQSLEAEGFQTDFQQADNSYNVEVYISKAIPLQKQNVIEFLSSIQKTIRVVKSSFKGT